MTPKQTMNALCSIEKCTALQPREGQGDKLLHDDRYEPILVRPIGKRLSLWVRMGAREWPNYIPLAPILRDYKRTDFNMDLTAGLVVGMVSIPQAIAYAFLAGVPPESGLYACLVPMILYAIFGSSRQLVVGPVAVAA